MKKNRLLNVPVFDFHTVLVVVVEHILFIFFFLLSNEFSRFRREAKK